jgi:hypothetical protein
VDLPLIRLAVGSVGRNAAIISVTDDDGSIDTSDWGPDNIRRRAWLYSVYDDWITIDKAKFEWATRQSIVDRIACPRLAVFPRKLVHQNPLLQRWSKGNNRHSRTGGIVEICHIIYHGAPGFQICRFLVSKLLAMQRVTLIRVKHANCVVEKAVILPFSALEKKGNGKSSSQNEWLPNTSIPICSIRSTALRHIADENFHV